MRLESAKTSYEAPVQVVHGFLIGIKWLDREAGN